MRSVMKSFLSFSRAYHSMEAKTRVADLQDGLFLVRTAQSRLQVGEYDATPEIMPSPKFAQCAESQHVHNHKSGAKFCHPERSEA